MTETVTVTEDERVVGTRGSRGIPIRILRGIGWTMVWLGALTLGFVVHQLYITTWFSQQNQAELDTEREAYFATAEVTEVEWVPEPVYDPETGAEPGQPADSVPLPELQQPRTIQVESAPAEGEAFALIRIPKLERLREGWNVVEGVSREDLRNGAGHMPWTPLPGQPGNSVISGHRTTYGAPFHELDELVPGDRIEVETPLGVHVYEMRDSTVVHPLEVWVTNPRAGAWLTLTTCNPKFSARERLVVFAELVEGPNADVLEGVA